MKAVDVMRLRVKIFNCELNVEFCKYYIYLICQIEVAN